MRSISLFILLAFVTPLGAAIVVSRPIADAIVTVPSITIEGRVDSSAASVTLATNGQVQTVSVIGNEWRFNDAPLTAGLNIMTIRADGEHDSTLFVTLVPGLDARPPQRVRFVWVDGTDDELQAIASGTLDPAPDPAALDRFVREVKKETADVFARAYVGTAISLGDADGDDVHTVFFKPFANDVYGLTPAGRDCGNQNLHGESSVYVGTFRENIVGRLENWAPMTVKDPVDVRIRDVAEALGRTAAHEVGHGVGLVAEDTSSPCAWMNGCLGDHSCPLFQNLHEGMHRFGAGAFIMDPGDLTANTSRIAEPAKDSRAEVRRPAVFCDFDEHYLQAIEPKTEGALP